MYYAKCTHPPGGATALAAVIGSSQLHDLSYMYVITPVLINTVVMLTVGIAFNAMFSWRFYPSALKKPNKASSTESVYPPINHEDFVYALSQVDSIVNISEEDLQEIYGLATGRTDLQKK